MWKPTMEHFELKELALRIQKKKQKWKKWYIVKSVNISYIQYMRAKRNIDLSKNWHFDKNCIKQNKEANIKVKATIGRKFVSVQPIQNKELIGKCAYV